MTRKLSTLGALIVALGSSFLASLCCIGPLLVVVLGAGGAWSSYITFFVPYRPYIISFVVMVLACTFYKLYLRPPVCKVNKACAHPNTLFIQKMIFWIISTLSTALLAFPWYEHLAYSK